MWILYAFLSALFAGITAVLAKIGIHNTDSTLATALRTIVVTLFAWILVFLTGSQTAIPGIDAKTLTFLILSGLATGASWICYFKALQTGDINKVTPIDKSSTVLTMLLAFLFLGEPLTPVKALAMLLIAAGAYMMIEKKKTEKVPADSGGVLSGSPHPAESRPESRRANWLPYALLSALFAALTAILGKIGIENIESTLGTAIRTIVVLLMSWLIVLMQNKHPAIKHIPRRNWKFITLSGLATGASWLFYYRALQTGPASVVVPIDKLSILVTIAFGAFVFHERLTRRSAAGLCLLTAGTLALLL